METARERRTEQQRAGPAGWELSGVPVLGPLQQGVGSLEQLLLHRKAAQCSGASLRDASIAKGNMLHAMEFI